MKKETHILTFIVPIAVRTFQFAFKYDSGTTSEAVAQANILIKEQEKELNKSFSLAKMMDIIATLNAVMKPLTPYEKEIIERYYKIQCNCSKHILQENENMKLCNTLIVQADKLIAEVPLHRKGFDEMMREAIVGHEGNDRKILVAGILIEVLNQYNKTAGDFDEQVKAFETSRITVGVFQYNDGEKKLQISRENMSQNGEWSFAKLGRMFKDEVEAVIPAMQKALEYL